MTVEIISIPPRGPRKEGKTTMTKQELKARVKEAFEMGIGFGPKLADIILLEANGDGSYIRVAINCTPYEYVVRADEFFPEDLFYVYPVIAGHEESQALGTKASPLYYQ